MSNSVVAFWRWRGPECSQLDLLPAQKAAGAGVPIKDTIEILN